LQKRKRSKSQDTSSPKRRKLNPEKQNLGPIQKPNISIKSPKKSKEETNFPKSPSKRLFVPLNESIKTPRKNIFQIACTEDFPKSPCKTPSKIPPTNDLIKTPKRSTYYEENDPVNNSPTRRSLTPTNSIETSSPIISLTIPRISTDSIEVDVPQSPIIKRSKPLTPRPNMKREDEECLIPIEELKKVKADLLSKF